MDTLFVSNKSLTSDCDLDLGYGNLHFVFDTLFYFALSFYWLVGCFVLNGPLRQYFSLYRAVSQREGE